MPTAEIPLTSLPADTPIAFVQDGAKFVVLRTTDGVYAFDDVCPHAFWPLSAGYFHDGLLECPGHAWEFNVRTGKCQAAPTYCLTPVSVAVIDDVVRLSWEASGTARYSATSATTSAKQCAPTA